MIEVTFNLEIVTQEILATAEIPEIMIEGVPLQEIHNRPQVISLEKLNILRKTIQNIRIKVTINPKLYLLKKPERLDLSGFLII